MKTGTHYRIAAVITAAGSSSRMQENDVNRRIDQPVEYDSCRQTPFLKKEYRILPGAFDADGKALTVLGAVTGVFLSVERISSIVITVPTDPKDAALEAKAALPNRFLRMVHTPVVFVPGGRTRRLSVYEALKTLSGIDFVLIHDGARPWFSAALVNRVIDAAIAHGAAIPVLPLTETPKIISDGLNGGFTGAFIEEHPNRETVFLAQTPQGFAFEPLLEAHRLADAAMNKENNAAGPINIIKNPGREWTDDAEIWHSAYPLRKIAAVMGEEANKKITFAEDLA
jgi:2-C-methyl-D-erythritol 4-phosphate cytidylyltransferase/2-C-methyl-D-erythritol 2,4-cyclodiphosphate synthase